MDSLECHRFPLSHDAGKKSQEILPIDRTPVITLSDA